MKRLVIAAVAGAAALVLTAPAALAHVTVQPTEAVTGSFARFVVRVPNERDDAGTTKVEVQLPESLVSVSFQPKPGWTRTSQTRERSAPVEVFGEEVTDYVATVTWEGGRIEPGEFEEFGFSARVPEDPTTLEFPAIQTYRSGEVVRWIGPEDADEPAGRVTTYRLGEGEDAPGQLELLSALAGDGQAGTDDADDDADDADDDDDDDDDGSDTGTVLGVIGIALGALALVTALVRRRSP